MDKKKGNIQTQLKTIPPVKNGVLRAVKMLNTLNHDVYIDIYARAWKSLIIIDKGNALCSQ